MAVDDDLPASTDRSIGDPMKIGEATTVSDSVAPYPGPRPFRIDESPLFFGRDRERAQLRSLVLGHALVLLYAQSGAGKTSLLNAGVIPAIQERDATVFPTARIQPNPAAPRAEKGGSNAFVRSMADNWAREQGGPTPPVITLTDFVRTLSSVHSSSVNEPRVLIIDQFEELFTQFPEYWRHRADFFAQVQDALGADPNLRILLSMREDYVAQADPYVGLLENRLQHRFRIQRLRRREALIAVTEPLGLTDRHFAPGAAEYLVEQLLQVRIEGRGHPIEITGEFVEPVQLQIVCSALWDALIASTDRTITREHIDRIGRVDRALAHFYGDVVRGAASRTSIKEIELRKWCESELITSGGTRALVYRGSLETEGLPNGVIDVLESQHLIRGEARSGAHWYELSHDTFVGAIQADNRLAFEAQAARTRRQWKWAVLAGGLVAVLSVMSLVGTVVYGSDPLAASPTSNLAIVRIDSGTVEVMNRGNSDSRASTLTILGTFIRSGALVPHEEGFPVPPLSPGRSSLFDISVCGEVRARLTGPSELVTVQELSVEVPCLPDLLIWSRAVGTGGDLGGMANQVIAAAVQLDGTSIAVGHDDEGGEGDAAVWTSHDGMRWTRATSPALAAPGSQRMDGAAIVDSAVFVVGSDSTSGEMDPAVWTSDAGRTWGRLDGVISGLHEAGNQAMRAVAVAAPGLVAVGRATAVGSIDAAVWTSTDGTTWSRQRSESFVGPGHQDMVAVTTFGHDLVVVGFEENEDRDAAVWIGCGGRWERINSPSFGGEGNQQMNAVLATDTGFVAVGYDESRDEGDAAAWTSSDGRSWERVPTYNFAAARVQTVHTLARVGSALVAGGVSGTPRGGVNGAIWLSANGADWIRLSPASTAAAALGGQGDQRINWLVLIGNRLVAVGSEMGDVDNEAAAWITDTFQVPAGGLPAGRSPCVSVVE